MGEAIQKYEKAFIGELNKQGLYSADGQGRWFYYGIVLCGYYVTIFGNPFLRDSRHKCFKWV